MIQMNELTELLTKCKAEFESMSTKQLKLAQKMNTTADNFRSINAPAPTSEPTSAPT